MGIFGSKKNKEGVSAVQNIPELPPIPELPEGFDGMDAPPLPDAPDELSAPSIPDIPSDIPSVPSLDMDANVKQEAVQNVSSDDELLQENSTPNVSVSDEIDNSLDIDIPDLDSLELPEFPDFEIEESRIADADSGIIDDVKPLRDSKKKSGEVSHSDLIHSEPEYGGPRYVKIDTYIKITDTIQIAKDEIESVIEEGGALMNIAGSKEKDVENFRNHLSTTIKLLYKMENTLFGR